MANYKLSPLCENDLEDIWLYSFNEWSQLQADSYYLEIMHTIKKLAAGEIKGRIASVRNGYLKYSSGKHYIFYTQYNDYIEIIRILHQSIDVERHLKI